MTRMIDRSIINISAFIWQVQKVTDLIFLSGLVSVQSA